MSVQATDIPNEHELAMQDQKKPTPYLKYILLVVNLVILIPAISLVLLNTTFSANNLTLDNWYGPKLSTPLEVLFFISGFFVVMAVLGLVGTWKENKCILITYATVMILTLISCVIIILILAVAMTMIEAAASGLNLAVSIDGSLISEYRPSGKDEFGNDLSSVNVALDELQLKFECCGINSYKDWNRNDSYWWKKYPGSVPDSCCRVKDEAAKRIGCGKGVLDDKVKRQKIYEGGCKKKAENYSRRLEAQIHGTLILFIVQSGVILLSIVLSFVLVCCCDARQRARQAVIPLPQLAVPIYVSQPPAADGAAYIVQVQHPMPPQQY